MPHPIEKQLADRAMALGHGGEGAAGHFADYEVKIDRIINRKSWN